MPCENKRDITLPQHNKHIWNREKKAPCRPSDKLNRQAVRLEAIFLMVCAVLSPIRCKTLLDGGRRRTKNLYGVF